MTEKEFDTQVRDLLQDATEEVSPALWDGISAGLDKKRGVVPLRIWSGVTAVAAVAAVVAIVVLRHPTDVPEDPSNPIEPIAQVSVPEVPDTAPVPETTQAPETMLTQTVSRPVRFAQATPAAPQTFPATSSGTPAQPEQSVQQTNPQNPVETVPEQTTPPVDTHPTPPTPPSPEPAPVNVDEWAKLLAQAEEPSFSRKLSLSASANVQDSRRGSFSGVTNILSPMEKKGITNEDMENDQFSFPFSVGVGIKYNFAPRWSVGTGVRYSYLGRSFKADYYEEGFVFTQVDIVNSQHWLGIPLHAYYEFVNQGPWRLHAFAGGSVEFLVDNDYLIHGYQSDFHRHLVDFPPQWSVDAGVGVEFRVSPSWGIYLDPGVHYYFGTDKQPRSLRTVNPFRIDMELGLRFTFGQ